MDFMCAPFVREAAIARCVRFSRRAAAKILSPAAERETFPVKCDGWLEEGQQIVPGLRALTVDGSKTPGELMLLLEERTLITGDLIRGQRGGSLNLLPDAKLRDKA